MFRRLQTRALALRCQMAGGHAWKTDGGRWCEHCGFEDYGEPGGPGHDHCKLGGCRTRYLNEATA